MKPLRHHLCVLPHNYRPLSQHTLEQFEYFQYWQNQRYPFVFTRQPPGIENSQLQLAIPYYNPATQQKIRLAFLLPKAGLQLQALPTLNEIFPKAEKHWNTIGVYGSFCWQYLTGERYVQANSDLDLLFPYLNQSMVSIENTVQQIKFKLQLTVDGEIRFPGLGDCALYELLNQKSQTILFKSTHALELVPREIVYASFPTLFC